MRHRTVRFSLHRIGIEMFHLSSCELKEELLRALVECRFENVMNNNSEYDRTKGKVPGYVFITTYVIQLFCATINRSSISPKRPKRQASTVPSICHTSIRKRAWIITRNLLGRYWYAVIGEDNGQLSVVCFLLSSVEFFHEE